MTTEVPKWAYDWLRTRLPGGAELINAVLLDKGRYSGSVLANTTRGAVLLTKSSVGEPKMRFLALPGPIVDVTCKSCGQAMELHHAPLPADVHCSRCGAVQHVAAAKEIDRAQNKPGEAAARPPVKK